MAQVMADLLVPWALPGVVGRRRIKAWKPRRSRHWSADHHFGLFLGQRWQPWGRCEVMRPRWASTTTKTASELDSKQFEGFRFHEPIDSPAMEQRQAKGTPSGCSTSLDNGEGGFVFGRRCSGEVQTASTHGGGKPGRTTRDADPANLQGLLNILL